MVETNDIKDYCEAYFYKGQRRGDAFLSNLFEETANLNQKYKK